jgi:hypothetical protein
MMMGSRSARGSTAETQAGALITLADPAQINTITLPGVFDSRGSPGFLLLGGAARGAPCPGLIQGRRKGPAEIPLNARCSQ